MISEKNNNIIYASYPENRYVKEDLVPPLAKIKKWFIMKKKGGKNMEKPSIARNTGGGVTNLKGDKGLRRLMLKII